MGKPVPSFKFSHPLQTPEGKLLLLLRFIQGAFKCIILKLNWSGVKTFYLSKCLMQSSFPSWERSLRFIVSITFATLLLIFDLFQKTLRILTFLTLSEKSHFSR